MKVKMGSSTKKHKSDKRRKRSRSPETEKERHKHHKKHRSHRQKQEEVQTISSSDSEVEEVAVNATPAQKKPAPSGENAFVEVGKSHETLSVDQTNALRARLGLKPLQVQTPSTDGGQKLRREGADGTDMGEFVHRPPENISHKAKTEKIRQKLAERKEKRAIEQKMLNVKRLGESDDETDDAKKWVKKAKEKDEQRKAAESREKMLDEMDKEFGIGELVEEDRRYERQDLYASRDLRGLKIAHSFEGFQEGMNVILTLKDQNVLDEDKDTLINVNMVDNEKHKKNLERRKKKPGVYDDDDDDFDPLLDEKKQILSKYDEEIEGEREDSFAIGEELTEAERIKKRLAVKKRLMAQKSLVDLNSETRLASDYFTEEEINAKFRKPGKAKKLRKKPKKLTADELMPLQNVTWPSEDMGKRRSKKGVAGIKSEDDMDIARQDIDIALDVDDIPAIPDDLYNVKIEPDEAEQELQFALNKARKLKQKEVHNNPVEKIAKEIIEGGSGYNLEGPDGSIVLNSTSEFCRTLGDIPTYGLSGNREEENDLLDFERYLKEDSKNNSDDKKARGAWSQVETDDRVEDNLPTDVAILDEEPDVGKGVAGALRLALSKGYLEKETVNRPSASRFAHLQAQNYTIDDKAHIEDDKFGRRERFSGPTSEFKEKDNYKPNVNLAYIDDDGHLLGSKEAFRYLSHKFHGKGPGKNKVEKRMKKNEQEGLMKQMSSTDTPLRTLTMLQKKQKATQSAYVVLSGKSLGVGSTIISKTK